MSEENTVTENEIALTDAEKKSIEAQAKKEIAATVKKKLRAEYKASFIAEQEKKNLFSSAEQGELKEGLVPVFVDLPSVAECIRLDGVAFHPGRTYNVLPGVRAQILEIMGRGQDHEDSLNGKTAIENQYRRKNTQTVTL